MLPDVPYMPIEPMNWSPAHEESLRVWLQSFGPAHSAAHALLALLDIYARDVHAELLEEAQEAASKAMASVDVDRQRIEEALPPIVLWEMEFRRMNAMPEGQSKISQLAYHTRHKPENMTAEEFKALMESLLENLPKIQKATEAFDKTLAEIIKKAP